MHKSDTALGGPVSDGESLQHLVLGMPGWRRLSKFGVEKFKRFLDGRDRVTESPLEMRNLRRAFLRSFVRETFQSVRQVVVRVDRRSLDQHLKRLGARIRELRTEKGWSQEELAHRVGVDRTYQSDVERGQRNFGVRLVFDYAKALRVGPEDLVRLG